MYNSCAQNFSIYHALNFSGKRSTTVYIITNCAVFIGQ